MKRWNTGSISLLLESTIQSTFRETTRNGNHKGFVILVLTPHVMLINEASYYQDNKSGKPKVPKVYDIDSLKLKVFKKSKRQTLKIAFENGTNRYFELEKTSSKKAIWTIWCKQVLELQNKEPTTQLNKDINKNVNSLDWNIVHHKWKPQHFVWSDKHSFLGSNREEEDQSRPTPVPGLGRAEDIKLLYLKPQYFGCWDQSEHWVQCESNFALSNQSLELD